MAVNVHSPTVPPDQAPVFGEAPLIDAPVDVHRALDDVRRMKEFAPEQPGLLDDLLQHPQLQELGRQWDRIMDQLMEAFRRFLGQVRPPAITGLPDSIRELFNGFVIFLIVLLALYAFYLVLGWILRIREERAAAPAETARFFEQTALISADHHYRQAHELSARNRYEDALRQLYLASLCLLDERGVIPFETTRSNREYLTALSLRSEAESRLAFARLARRFEAARYGNQPVPAEQWPDCEREYQNLERNVHG